MSSITHALVKIDHYSTFIPGFSTLTNLVDLFHKYVTIPLIERLSPSLRNPYFTYIKNKDLRSCVFLLIPLIGNIVTILLFMKKEIKDKKKISQDLRPESTTKNLKIENSNQRPSIKSCIALSHSGTRHETFKRALKYEENNDFKKAADAYLQAGFQGCIKSMNNLAVLYQKGFGVEKDPKCAFDLYLSAATKCLEGLENASYAIKAKKKAYVKAARRGFGVIFNNLAVCYAKGKGTAQNIDLAFSYFSHASSMNYAPAHYNLGIYYKLRQKDEQDLKTAFHFFKLGEAQNHPSSIYRLAECYERGLGVEPNLQEALKLYLSASKAGVKVAKHRIAEALFKIANDLQSNHSLEIDKEIVFKFYSTASSFGHLPSQFEQARCYELGIGTKKDLFKAKKLYKIFVESGDLRATAYLADILILENPRLAFPYIETLAKQEIPGYMHKLADCYENGKGTKKDIDLAIKWYQKATDKGDDNACNHLGMLYEFGLCVPKDHALALKYYQISADRNSPGGLANLGHCFEEGIGVDIDLKCALSLYAHSAKLDNPIGRMRYESLSEKLKLLST